MQLVTNWNLGYFIGPLLEERMQYYIIWVESVFYWEQRYRYRDCSLGHCETQHFYSIGVVKILYQEM